METPIATNAAASMGHSCTDDEFARASVPDLGQLMKQAVDRGLIAPVKSYSENAAKWAAARAAKGQP